LPRICVGGRPHQAVQNQHLQKKGKGGGRLPVNSHYSAFSFFNISTALLLFAFSSSDFS
jgi:hypothetical protein